MPKKIPVHFRRWALGAPEAYKYGWMIILYPLGAGVGLMLLGTGLGKLEENFAPYYGEWCHFSYGDREWAAFYGQAKTLYAPLHRT